MPRLRTASGSCLCGAVTFQARLPARWVAHCHCTRCQRAHGAAFVTWVSLDAEALTVADPAGVLRTHVAQEGGHRSFCGTCGSPMFFRADRWPGEVHVARALFLERLQQQPQAHGYHDTHVDWVQLGDGLARKP